MSKITGTGLRAGLTLTTAAGLLAGASVSLAGPGCMGDSRNMHRGFYPPGHMMPPAARWQNGGRGYAAAPYAAMPPQHYQTAAPAQRGGLEQAASDDGQQRPVETRAQAADIASEAGAKNVTVRIDGMRFEPAAVTVEPGTTVTWIHASSMPHTVSGADDGPDSSTLNRGQSYSHTFETAGQYDYICEFHPSMQGRVNVMSTDSEG